MWLEGSTLEAGMAAPQRSEETLPTGQCAGSRTLLPQALGGDAPRAPGEQVPCACAWSAGLRQTALQACGGGGGGGGWKWVTRLRAVVGRPARGFPALSDARPLRWRWKGPSRGPHAPGRWCSPQGPTDSGARVWCPHSCIH